MKSEAILYTIISSLGLGLNLVIGSIIVFGLKVDNIELIVALLISIVDSLFYITNIVHAIYTANMPIVNGIYFLVPTWYNSLNIAIIASTLLSSIGLVTILSIIRYVKICLCKKVSKRVWIFISLLLVCLSIASCSIMTQPYIFICSSINFNCGPKIQMNTEDGKPDLMHSKIYCIINSIFIIIQLPIITFCYIKVTSTYYTVAKPHYLKNLIVRRRSDTSHIQCSLNQFPIIYDREEIIQNEHLVKKKRTNTIIKISLIMVAYITCFLSEAILILFIFAQVDIPIHANIFANCLVCCIGIISPSFILLINVQAQDILRGFFKSIYMIIRP